MDQLMAEIAALTDEQAALERELAMAQARFHELDSLVTDLFDALTQDEEEYCRSEMQPSREETTFLNKN